MFTWDGSNILIRLASTKGYLYYKLEVTHKSKFIANTTHPKEWNKLPMAIQASENVDTFKRKLKTFLFANCHF